VDGSSGLVERGKLKCGEENDVYVMGILFSLSSSTLGWKSFVWGLS